ncbi:MAG: M56 family metallopeptidase, partial [Planctomycetota bacterium]
MSWLLEHLVSGALVVLAVAVLVRLARPRPAVAHVLWVLALVKLLVPAVVPLRVLPSPWSSPEAAVAAGGPGATSSRFNLPASQRLLPKPNLRVAVPLVAPVGGNAGADDRMHAPIAGATGEATPSPALELAGTVTPAAANPAIPWPALLLLVWAAGAVRVGLGVWRSVRSVRRQMAQASDPTPAQQRALDELAAALEVVAPRMRVVPGRGSPFIWAWGRAVLVWPSQWSACDSASRAILAHELAHLRRRDHWIARFEVIASALLWWHPLFWWTRSRLRQEAELACDAWALWAVPRARRAYASALIDTLEQEVQAMPVATALGARSPTRRAFERRLTMILNHRVPRHFASWAALPVLGLSMAFVAGPAFAQDPEERGKSRSLERRVERAVRAALEQEEARGGLPSGLSVRVEIESEDEADAKHSDDAEGAADAMRAALREARREIRSDPDLRELGIAGDVEGLVGSLLDGDGDFGGALESLIGKAMSQGLAEARMEIRSDSDLRELGLTGDVEELVGSLLGDGDGDFGGALESLIGKAMSQGLAEARMEIRSDPDLRELGLTG